MEKNQSLKEMLMQLDRQFDDGSPSTPRYRRMAVWGIPTASI